MAYFSPGPKMNTQRIPDLYHRGYFRNAYRHKIWKAPSDVWVDGKLDGRVWW